MTNDGTRPNHRGLIARGLHEIRRAWRRANLRFTGTGIAADHPQRWTRNSPSVLCRIDHVPEAGLYVAMSVMPSPS